MVLLETKKKFLELTKCQWVRNVYIPNEQRFILLLETNNTFRVKIFMALLETEKEFLKPTKRPWVRNDYIANEQRFILLIETNKVSLYC